MFIRHTPSPWRIKPLEGKHYGTLVELGEDGPWIEVCGTHDPLADRTHPDSPAYPSERWMDGWTPTREELSEALCDSHYESVQDLANARLIAAAPDLLGVLTMGVQVQLPEFLEWLADRLVHVYGESPNVDFVHTLRDRASAARDAIAKAVGEQP